MTELYSQLYLKAERLQILPMNVFVAMVILTQVPSFQFRLLYMLFFHGALKREGERERAHACVHASVYVHTHTPTQVKIFCFQ